MRSLMITLLVSLYVFPSVHSVVDPERFMSPAHAVAVVNTHRSSIMAARLHLPPSLQAVGSEKNLFFIFFF